MKGDAKFQIHEEGREYLLVGLRPTEMGIESSLLILGTPSGNNPWKSDMA